jgi:hypothetical protein
MLRIYFLWYTDEMDMEKIYWINPTGDVMTEGKKIKPKLVFFINLIYSRVGYAHNSRHNQSHLTYN